MAGEDGMPPNVLIDELRQAADRFDFFEALRLIETLHPDKPRLGESLKAGDDAIRLSQEPGLEFPASAISAYVAESANSAKPRLAVNFMGLFGPNGPLPLHLTEYARQRARHHHDPTLARFADVFHHRMISLFYRAWANARPEVHYDRPHTDRFAFYVGSLAGVAGEAFQQRDALADRAKLFYAGHFSVQTKHPDGLRAVIADVLGLGVRIEEFVGEWMDIQPAEQTRLGASPEIASLGQTALLGASVWGCQHKFKVVLGPMALADYLALLPGAVLFEQVKSAVRNYVGDEYVWDAQLVLKCAEVPPEMALGVPPQQDKRSMNGYAQLGWSMWLGPRSSECDADDLLLDPFIAVGANC
ncbi:type VI secretion system baseplate subunit TssG [Methylomonas koyamae]|nr:type VI secretion system baseplate subunit TssG [Methylomonas koyamae]